MRFYRHRMDLFRTDRDMLQKTFLQMREVSIRESFGSDTLVDLKDMHPLPREVFVCQGAQHNPGRVATADGKSVAPAGGDRRTGIGSDSGRAFFCHGIGVVKG